MNHAIGTDQTLRTRTCTIVLQRVASFDDLFSLPMADALQEIADDIRAGRAGNSLYERHITKNGFRADVIHSVYPGPNSVAQEDVVTGCGNAALKERLLSMRRAAAFLPGGADCNPVASFACSPEEAAKQVRGLLNDQLAALGVAKEEDEPEPDDESGT